MVTRPKVCSRALASARLRPITLGIRTRDGVEEKVAVTAEEGDAAEAE